jgi:DNA-directed RNA polymerase specialized sigma subunit
VARLTKHYDNGRAREIILKIQTTSGNKQHLYTELYEIYKYFLSSEVIKYMRIEKGLEEYREDLEQEAYIGMCYAAKKFDLDNTYESKTGTSYYKFTTYATHWIRCYLREYNKYCKHPIKIGTHIIDGNKKIMYAKDRLGIKDSVLSTEQIEMIQEDTGLSKEKIETYHNTYFPLMSMATPSLSTIDIASPTTPTESVFADSDAMIEGFYSAIPHLSKLHENCLEVILELYDYLHSPKDNEKINRMVNSKKRLSTQRNEYAKHDSHEHDRLHALALCNKYGVSIDDVQHFMYTYKDVLENIGLSLSREESGYEYCRK